jgi:hypothetical protein
MVTSGTAVIQQASGSFGGLRVLPSLQAATDTAPVGSAAVEHPDKARRARRAGNQQGRLSCCKPRHRPSQRLGSWSGRASLRTSNHPRSVSRIIRSSSSRAPRRANGRTHRPVLFHVGSAVSGVRWVGGLFRQRRHQGKQRLGLLGTRRLRRAGVGEVGPVCDGGCLNAAGSVEHGQDIRYVDAGGLGRDESSAANVTIAAARADQAQHLDLSRRQAEVPLSLASGRPVGDAEAAPPGQRPDLFMQRGRPPAAAELRQTPVYGQTILMGWSTSRPAWTGSPAPC